MPENLITEAINKTLSFGRTISFSTENKLLTIAIRKTQDGNTVQVKKSISTGFKFADTIQYVMK